MAKIFSAEARRRIRDAVRTVEQMPQVGRLPRRDPKYSNAARSVCIAADTISTRMRGTVYRTNIEEDDEATDPADISKDDTAENTDVINLAGHPIWKDSLCLVETVSFINSRTKAVTYTNSARRIFGKSESTITAGSSGSLSNVRGIDGHYADTEAEIYLPTDFVSINGAISVWAEWVEQFDRFEVYSADCDEAATPAAATQDGTAIGVDDETAVGIDSETAIGDG